jgi:hydroxymethylpyrimidine pyrophosphatase-like HAD family hydrolase
VDFRTDERFHQACFGADAAGATLQTFRNHGLDPCIYVDHADYDIVMSETPSTCVAHQARVGAAASMGDLDATVARDPVYAFSVLGLSRDRLGPVLDELVTVTGAHAILFAEPDYGEFGLIVNPPGISKWTGIEAFCRLHDIDASEVMAVGDGLNDVPMLQRAAVAVAVRGGTPEATAVAHHLIDPPATAGWRQVVELVHQH